MRADRNRVALWVILLSIGAGPALAAAADEPAGPTDVQLRADWLRQNQRRQAPKASAKPKPEQDALGGCDGRVDGRWGFHTQNEPNPWWQVDLGAVQPIGRVVLYNRCDQTAGRASRVQLLVSDDGRQYREVYRHDGRTFFGFTDKQPLTVTLEGVRGRWLRLQLPATSYFHLDEVEVYAPGGQRNLAINRPATQSSISTWSVVHAQQSSPPLATDLVIARGRKLADDLGHRDVDVAAALETFVQLQRRQAALAANASEADRQAVYCDACAAVRRLALANPLLDFDRILFVKSAPTLFPHMSDQFYGWWSRPGGGVYLLEGFRGNQPRLVCLTADMPPGNFIRPELSYDGRKVLFAYCRHYAELANLKDKADKANLPEDAFYHLFEMNVDGTGRRQLTRGRYDDFDGRYLPSGEIAFLSTRKGQFLETSSANTAQTVAADLPDSYVRCGGDNYRPVPVFTLHMLAPGGQLRPLSAFENFEWTPAVAHDGRLLYTRWDYIDRFNGHFFSLWSTNVDGSNPQLVYGNYTVRPQVVCEARPIPNSPRLVFTAAAHHSIIGGSLVLFDRNRGTEGDAPLVRLTPEVPFPETESNIDSYYANPYPLSEEHYLVAWSDRRLPPHCRMDDTAQNPVNATGLYLYDAFGNLTLLYRDPELASACPVPVRPRTRPPIYTGQPDSVRYAGAGAMLVHDVYQGLSGMARGTIKEIRVVGVPPKLQPHMNRPTLGVSREDPGKFLIGSAPVAADGSAHFLVPAGVAVLFQAVDAEGRAVQTMRSLTYVGAGQTLACGGCHESREAAPPVGAMPLAAASPPARLRPGPEGSWPLRYDRLVQPVLDRYCVECHRPQSVDRSAAACDLTAARSYDTILAYANKDLHQLVFERDRSLVGDCPARQSKLLQLLTDKPHAGVRLDPESLERLQVWMDLYAQRQGHYTDQQAADLAQFRQRWLQSGAPAEKPR